MALQLDILEGPSKFDLMLAIFDGGSDRRREVTFTVAQRGHHAYREQIVTLIDGADREDGSSENWLIKGWHLVTPSQWKSIGGYYNTKTRRGWLAYVQVQ